jgi:hypothetical protein
MTRTDVDAKSMSRRSSRRRMSLRRLLVLPVTLLLVAAPTVPAVAAGSTSKEALSGYKHPSTAKKETKPAKAKEVPHEEPAPTTTPAPVAKQSTLPFTGFDLSWTVGFGLLLMGAGGSIVLVQRRQRRSSGR